MVYLFGFMGLVFLWLAYILWKYFIKDDGSIYRNKMIRFDGEIVKIPDGTVKLKKGGYTFIMKKIFRKWN